MYSLRLATTASLLSLAVASAFTPAIASAQQGRLLEEVIVTAKKKAEDQQDVPISISAFTGDALDALGLNQSNELGQFIPGLEIGTSSGEGAQLIVFLRGAGLNDFNTNNAGPVGIYADEVYISSPILTAFQFFDTERLEVLKGPQGTLYGRNTTGGAIKFISRKPTEEFEANLRASYGNFNRSEIEAAVSGPVTEKVRARAAVSKVDSDGWLDNLVTGDEENGVDTLSWRGIVDADLSDSVFMRLNVHGSQVDQPSFKFQHVGTLPGGVDALGYGGTDDLYEGEYNLDGGVDVDSTGAYLQFDIDRDGFTITSVTAYDEVESLVEEETDSSPLDLLFTEYGVDSETFSQELRIAGANEKVDWLGGVFYLKEDMTQTQTIDLFNTLRAFTGGISDPTGSLLGAPILRADVTNDQTIETYAVFGQADIALNDRWTATLGLRYTDENRTFEARGDLVDELIFGPDGFTVYDFRDLELDDSAVSWRVGLDYRTESDVLLYTSVSRGFKSGGFNGGFLSLDPAESFRQVQPYDPEFLTAYEVGFKGEFLDGKLRLNSALFYNDFEDLQVFTLVNTDALPIQVLDNSSAAEVLGLEFDALWYPTDSLLFNVTGALMQSELKDFVSDTGADFTGNEIARTPETSITALVRYDHTLASSAAIFGQASIAYKSEQFFSTENSPLQKQEAYELVNARIGYRHSSDSWGLALFANNLLDEEYLTNSTDLSDFGLITNFIGVPRTFGIELSVDL